MLNKQQFERLTRPSRFGVAGLWLAILALTALPACADSSGSTPQGAYISVSGTGKVEVIPDEVRFVVGIDAKEPTARQAYDAVETKMAAALKVLQKLGIEPHNIQAMHLTLNPIIDYKQRDRVIAHDARRDVQVKVEDMKTYARAMEALAELDVTRFQQVQLGSSRSEQLRIEALELAYENAEFKATKLAGKAGKKLLGASQIVEGGVAQPGPLPQMRVAAMMDAENGGSASVSSGLITLQSQVSVIFAIE